MLVYLEVNQRRSTTNRVSFQSPSVNVGCCHLNILATSETTPCIRRISAYQTLDHIAHEYMYLVHSWSNPRNDSEFFTWFLACHENLNYDTQAHFSVLQTCVDIVLNVWMTCDLKIYYQMSQPGATISVEATSGSRAEGYSFWGDTCYIRYDSTHFVSELSWDLAQSACQTINGSLVSVSSEAEWSFLMKNSFFREESSQLIYIGYRTVSKRLFFSFL